MRPDPAKLSVLVVVATLAAGCAQSPASGLFKARPGSTASADRSSEPEAARQPVVLGSRAAIGDTREPSSFVAGSAAVSPAPATATRRDVTGSANAPTPEGAEPLAKPAGATPAATLPSGKTSDPTAGKRGAATAAGVIIVGDGDTLLKIASRHRVSVSALMTENRLLSLAVAPGQQLVIPKR
jgi:LysM repeat protein